MTETYFGITDTGKVRENNEDAFIAQQVLSDRFTLACVIDGVGGYTGGEIAADIARKSILEYFSIPSGEMIPMMKESFIVANDKIFAEKQNLKNYDSMACVLTLALVDIENNQFYYAHVGDTRLYLLRDNSLVKVSKDHSFVGFLEDTGRLSEDAAMNHPKRNEINKALGFGMQPKNTEDYIETGHSPFLPGDLLLLCSDGLTDMVSKKEITSILVNDNFSLEQKGRQLIEAANNRGGRDNITVVLVKNNKKPLRQEAMRPTGYKKKEIEEEVTTSPDPLPAGESQKPAPAKKKNKWLFPLMAFIGIMIFTAGWYFLKNKKPVHEAEEIQITQALETRNPQEIKLQASINSLPGDTLFIGDPEFTSPLIISDTIWIERDSLYIKSKANFVIQSDSAYSGPAFVMAGNCRHIVFDSLLVRNFSIGVIVQNSALELKNMRFENCVTGIQNMFAFRPGQYVSGRLTDFHIDSLPHTND